MANPNPTKARTANKRKAQAKLGDVEALRGILWRVLNRIDNATATDNPNQPIDADTLAAFRLLPQVAGVYLKSVEVGEFETRLTVLEGGRLKFDGTYDGINAYL